ncbi:PREDICTED: apolipoprotein B receptor [Nanorana parkeri]|uniref:apolipoprotein B receptor n=1 Tax=Nanorana parkeri TaxID=125878 RepID=UPI000854E050|nr:PREDICTED: apolipoprotein B receptor [Nanorana parkeri]
MGVPHFLAGSPILSPSVAPAPESLHPAEEPKDEGTTSETILRRKSSIRRPKGKQPVTSEEQSVEPPPAVIAPLRMGVPLFSGVPAHVAPAPASSHPAEEPREEKTASEDLTIKPKKGFLKHAGFGGAHPGMMHELQARLHKKKPKE